MPLSMALELAGMLVAVLLELGEPWEGVAGLGREEEVAGSVAGLLALSLTDSHSEAPLVLVHSEFAGWDNFILLQAGCTRYFKGRGPFCQKKGKKNSGGGSFGLSHYHGCQICTQAVWGSEMKLKRERQAESVNDCQTFQCHLCLGKLP